MSDSKLEFPERLSFADAHLPENARTIDNGQLSGINEAVDLQQVRLSRFPFMVTLSDPSAAYSRLSSFLRAEEEYGRLFLFLPLFMGLGAAAWFGFDNRPGHTIVGIGFLCSILAVYFTGQNRALFWPSIFGAAFMSGMLFADWQASRTKTVILDSPVTVNVTGRIIDLEKARSGRWRYTLDVISTREPLLKRPPSRVRITGLSTASDVNPGDLISGRTRLSPPSGPVLPGGYDFAFQAYFEGIGAVGFFYGKPSAETTPRKIDTWALASRLKQMQARLSLAITQRMGKVLSGDVLAFASAITVNDRRALSQGALNALRNSGLAHIIAISGLHMALAAGMFFWLVRGVFSLFPAFSQRYPVKKIAAVAAIFAASLYLFISGAPVSAVRAYIMLFVMLVAVIVGRSALNLRNLAFAAFCIIITKPSAVLTPGFLMSFAATAALIAGYNSRVLNKLRSVVSVKGTVSGSLSFVFKLFGGIALTSLVGGGATGLIAAVTFNTIPTYSVLANVLAMPVFSLVGMPAALGSLLAMPVGLEAPFLHILGFSLDVTLRVAKWVAELGGVQIVGHVPVWLLTLGCLLLFAGCLLRNSRASLSFTVLYIAVLVAAVSGVAQNSLPDMIIYEDGELAALIDGNSLAVNKKHPAAFVTDQWKRSLNIKDIKLPEDLRSLSDTMVSGSTPDKQGNIDPGRLPVGTFFCLEKKWCAARINSAFTVVLIQDPQALGYACDHANIVISMWRHSFRKCRSGALLIDANTLKRNGSISVRTAPTGDILQSGASQTNFTLATAVGRQNRAWEKHRQFDWRSGTFLPPAEYTINDNAE